MKVDASGLVMASQRLVSAVAAVGGGGLHPPLAADPTSVAAAGRLTTAGTELSSAMSAHVLALIASLEHLMGVAVTYTETDARNAAALRALSGAGGPAPVAGIAPPAPPVPPDLRAPIEPVMLSPEAISAGAHAGDASSGEEFINGWSRAAATAREAADHLRGAVQALPEVLDGPASTPAVTRHLTAFADGLTTYADRAQGLARQAADHQRQQHEARSAIPSPAVMTNAQNRVTRLDNANAASGGRLSVALAGAISDKQKLDEQALNSYGDYTAQTIAATGGQDSGTGETPDTPGGQAGPSPTDPADSTGQPGAGLAGDLDTADALAPEGGGELAGMMPQLLGTMVGAAGGLLGGAFKAPQQAAQPLTQLLSQATKGVSGAGKPETGSPPESGEPGGGEGSPSGGGDPAGPEPTMPAGGDGVPGMGVSPSTGAPPEPAVLPAGATSSTSPPSVAGGGTMSPMGVPMGGMGGMGGAPGGGPRAGESKGKNDREIRPREIPHTEDITGRTDTNRLEAVSAASRGRPTPPDDNDDDDAPSTRSKVRRLVLRPPKEDV